VLESDFFLADLFSDENHTISDNLKVILQETQYKVKDPIGKILFLDEIKFNDGQQQHRKF